jgi:hypothetical protein
MGLVQNDQEMQSCLRMAVVLLASRRKAAFVFVKAGPQSR